MPIKGTRYGNAREFEPASDGRPVFGGVRPRRIPIAHGAIEHVVKLGDRLDLLARHYYNDERLWWRIADANPSFVFAGDMVLAGAVVRAKKADGNGDGAASESEREPGMEGTVILIPQARE